MLLVPLQIKGTEIKCGISCQSKRDFFSINNWNPWEVLNHSLEDSEKIITSTLLIILILAKFLWWLAYFSQE